jgi:hypothetical protein
MDNLATELLHMVKMQSKRWFIAFIIILIMFFVSNALWLYAWCLPTEETTEEYTVTSDDGNAIYNHSGEVSCNVSNSESKENKTH